MSKLYAVMLGSLICVGCTTYRFELAVDSVTEGGLWSAWGPDVEDTWIVGGQVEEGVVLRGAGDQFEPFAVPEGTPLLNWVHGLSASDVWVGGLSGTLLHWDGSDWQDYSIPMDEAIWGVHAVSTDDVYAVGGLSGWGGTSRVALRFDGEEWSPLELPSVVDELSALFKVHSDGTNVWLVGARGTVLVESDGLFEVVPTDVSADISTVHSRGDGSVVMVGGLSTGVILAGTKNEGVRLVAETPSRLFGVHVTDAGEAVVAGMNGYLGTVSLASDEVTSLVSPTGLILHAVYGQENAETYAVGGDIGSIKASYTGVILSSKTP